jgi:hypothetical protein
MKAKVTEVLLKSVLLADSDKIKGIRVSVPVNLLDVPRVGSEIEITEPTEGKKPVTDKDTGRLVDFRKVHSSRLVVR